MSLKIVQGALAADVTALGTFTVSYPSGTTGGTFTGGQGHKLVTAPQNDVYAVPADFTLTFGASSITVTLAASFVTTLKSGQGFYLQLEQAGEDDNDPTVPSAVFSNGVAKASPVLVNLGSPAVSAANNVCAAQAIAGAANAVINGALAASGVATMDCPRSVQSVSTGVGDTTQNIIVTGKDAYGVALTEKISLNGTTVVHGAKAFKTISQIAVSAALAGNLTVGSDTKLGLPIFLQAAGLILKEILDGATATAGTTVAGDVTKPTNATGDVRGTYAPNTTANGAHSYQLVLADADPSYLGLAQA